MNLFKNKIFLIVVLVVVILIIAISMFLIIRHKQDLSPDNTPPENGSVEYPDTLLEGTIVSVSSTEPANLVIEADISKIIVGAEKMKKTIAIDSDTKFLLYNLANKQEGPLGFDELKPDDNVLVVTKESTRQEITTRETFTATKVTKIVNEL